MSYLEYKRLSRQMHEEKWALNLQNKKTTRKPGIYRKAHGVSTESLMITDVGSAQRVCWSNRKPIKTSAVCFQICVECYLYCVPECFHLLCGLIPQTPMGLSTSSLYRQFQKTEQLTQGNCSTSRLEPMTSHSSAYADLKKCCFASVEPKSGSRRGRR